MKTDVKAMPKPAAKAPAKMQKPMTMAEYQGSPMDRAADKKALKAINAMRKRGMSTATKERQASDKAHMWAAKAKG